MNEHSQNQNKTKRPSTIFLVFLNGLLFYSILALKSNVLGLIVGIFATAAFMVVSGLWHGIVVLIERKMRINPTKRTIAFLLPLIILIGLPYIGIKPAQKINKQRPAISPSGQVVAKVGTEDGYWKIRFDNNKGKELFTDHTDFVGHLNIYWIWDKEERFWVYNSDDGSVYCWLRDNSVGWYWVRWGTGHKKWAEKVDFWPPDDLYPGYAVKETQG